MTEDVIITELYEWAAELLRGRAIRSTVSRLSMQIKFTPPNIGAAVDALDIYLNDRNTAAYVYAIRTGDSEAARAIRRGIIEIIETTA